MTGIALSRTDARVIAAPMPFAPPVMSTTCSFTRRATRYSRTKQAKLNLLATKIEKTAVERVVHTSQERRFIRAEIQRERRHFVRLSHPAYRLRMGEFTEHLCFAPGIMLAQVTVHKRGMHAGGRNAIAADVTCEVILGHRVSHGDHRAFAGGIRKAVGQTGRARDRRHVEDHPATVCFHVFHGGQHTVIEAFHIYFVYAVEISLAGRFELADMGDAGVVHQRVDAAALGQRLKRASYILLICDIAFVCRRLAARFQNFPDGVLRLLPANVNHIYTGTAGCEAEGDGTTDAAGAARDDCRFPVEPEAI